MPSLNDEYIYSKWSNNGQYEPLSDSTKTLCEDLIEKAGKLTHNLKPETIEKIRVEKLEQEIQLIRQHQRICRDLETTKRMKKTIQPDRFSEEEKLIFRKPAYNLLFSALSCIRYRILLT